MVLEMVEVFEGFNVLSRVVNFDRFEIISRLFSADLIFLQKLGDLT